MSLKVDKVQLDIIINNDQARKTMKALSDELYSARKELRGMTEGTTEWVAKSDRIKSIQTQMDNPHVMPSLMPSLNPRQPLQPDPYLGYPHYKLCRAGLQRTIH